MCIRNKETTSLPLGNFSDTVPITVHYIGTISVSILAYSNYILDTGRN